MNENEAIEELYSQFSERLERLAWAVLRDWPLAADAVQEAFGVLARRLAEVPESHRRGFLIRTVQLQAQNLRRKQQRSEVGNDVVREQAAKFAIQHASRKSGSEIERREILDEVQRAVKDLPTAQKVVLEMRLREEKSFAEIAKELDLPLGTVLSRMRLALQKLRTKLDDGMVRDE